MAEEVVSPRGELTTLFSEIDKAPNCFAKYLCLYPQMIAASPDLVRETSLCNYSIEYRDAWLSKELGIVTTECSSPEKALIPPSLKFMGHCGGGRGREDVRARRQGERIWKLYPGQGIDNAALTL